MATTKDYPKLVEQASKAVASVKDAELRRIAFQKILDDLMSEDGVSSETTRKPVAATRIIRGSATAKKPKRNSGPQAYIEELVSEGYFKKQKTISQVKAELENRGHHIPLTSMSGPLQKLCQRRVLRRQKISGEGKNKQAFGYSNW